MMELTELPATYVEGFHDLESVKKMRYKRLGRTELYLSELSLGGGAFGGAALYGDYDESEAIETIREGIRKGINYIDTAPWYGQGKSEEIIGKALKGIPRKAYYIATKIGRYELDPAKMFDFSPEKTRTSIDTSLKLLGVDYVDIIQIHDIEFAPSTNYLLNETLPTLFDYAIKGGRAKHLGATGYALAPLLNLVRGASELGKPLEMILTYCRFTLVDDSLLEVMPTLKKYDIGIVCASAPSMGLLTNKGPPSWHPAQEDTKKICKEAAEYCEKNNCELGRLAMLHAVTSSQKLEIATHLVGMNTRTLLYDNLKVVQEGCSKKDSEILEEIKER
ncbi:L-galactose dehydrogenase-like [Ctenocephalides felis]|uniref:L-galactose dehydrogenase-like n=1 Tax=Ctenocephalides felis TaxID=7515 RepID=UPI000E6E1963|nr:L-galactose dehydrogenase-like [Ctenocephalides felis]